MPASLPFKRNLALIPFLVLGPLGLSASAPKPKILRIEVPLLSRTHDNFIYVKASAFDKNAPEYFLKGEIYNPPGRKPEKAMFGVFKSVDGEVEGYLKLKASVFSGDTRNLEFTIMRDGSPLEVVSMKGRELYEESTITPSAESLTYKTLGRMSYYDGVSVQDISETFTFTNFDTYVFNEVYGIVDLSVLTIKYSGFPGRPLPINDPTAYFYLENVNGELTGTGEITPDGHRYNAELIQDEEGLYHLGINDSHFVDPLMRYMAGDHYDGFVPTSQLFLPTDAYKEFSGAKFKIVINSIGIGRITIIQEGQLFFLRDFIGDCYDSSYCIITDRAEPELGLGEETDL